MVQNGMRQSKVFLLFILVALTILIVRPSYIYGASNTYYVDGTNGDNSNNGTASSPFKTIQHAAQLAKAGDTVIIKAGVYRETVTPRNSGTENAPIIFKAEDGADVTISGTEQITGQWTQHSGNIYKKNITLGLQDGNQLFVDGDLMMEARWPNVTGSGNVFLLEPTFATVDSTSVVTGSNDLSTTDDVYKITDADMQNIDWTGGKIWHTSKPNQGWSAVVGAITAYDSSSKTISFTFDMNNLWVSKCKPKANNHYYLYGKLEALDVAREWFYDGTTLYLYKPNGGDPSNSVVEYKQRQNGFVLDDRSYIQVENMKLRACTITTNDNTNHCTLNKIIGNYVSHYSHGDAWHASQKNNTGLQLHGHYNEIKNSEVGYSSGNGIVVTGSWNRVINCYVHDVDYIGIYTAAIRISGSSHMISHNTLTRAGRALFQMDGIRHSRVQYNDMSYPGYLTADLAMVYGAGDGEQTEFKYNKFHNSNGHGGLYIDNYGRNFLVHHNVFYDNLCTYYEQQSGITLNGPIEYCLIYNNTLFNRGYIGGYYYTNYKGSGFGTYVFNNIAPDGIPESIDEINYSSNYVAASPGFVDSNSKNFQLTSTSVCKDTGVVIQGITDGYSGSAPDKGAYEYGNTPWTAGHNFNANPNPTFTELNVQYMNLVKNSNFDYDSLDHWTKTGTQNAEAISDSNGYYYFNPDSTVKSAKSVRLGTGVNGIEQTITGLESNTTYKATVWMKVDDTQTAEFGVKDFGGSTVSVTQGTADKWIRRIITFRTGPDSTNATIYMNKQSAGDGYVYCDDFGMIYAQETLTGSWKSTVEDSSGQDNNGIMVGKNLLQFDGTDDYVNIPHASNLSFGSASNGFSISTWVKTTASGQYFIAKARPNSSQSNMDYALGMDANGKLTFYRWNQANQMEYTITASNLPVINDGKWHHVAFVNQGLEDHRLYVDGKAAKFSNRWLYDMSNDEPLNLGRYVNATYGTTYFKGSLDEVKIYQTALDSFTVEDQYMAKELLSNTYMQNGLMSWSALGDSKISTDVVADSWKRLAYKGWYSLKTTNRTNTWNGPSQDILNILKANGQGNYDFSCYIRPTNTENMKLVIKTHDSSGDHYHIIEKACPSGQWTPLAGSANVTWTGTLDYAAIYTQSSSTNQDFWSDDFSLRKAD